MSDYEDRDVTGMSGGGTRGGQSPEEIEREIQRTRARMGRDIDALGEKLSPQNLKQQARDAVAEKAQDMVSNVGQQARRTGSRVVEFVRENPLPVAAVGLGVTWLFTLRTRSEVSGDQRTRLGRRLADRTARVRDKVSGAAGEVSERAGRARGGLEQMMEENPLALVAGAAILGLALGLVLPETRREHR